MHRDTLCVRCTQSQRDRPNFGNLLTSLCRSQQTFWVEAGSDVYEGVKIFVNQSSTLSLSHTGRGREGEEVNYSCTGSDCVGLRASD